MTLATLRRVMAAFGASVEVAVRGLGADTDRLLDEGHAVLVGSASAWLVGSGWDARAEVTYSEYGERGAMDLLAWHAPSRTLLVVEVKTELASMEAMLRRHDEKARLAATVATRRFGWRARVVARLLVLPEQRSVRRQVENHSQILERAYPARNVAVRRWCRAPDGPLMGLIFLPDTARSRCTRTGGPNRRVRLSGRSAV
jgi:hypothetical protein